MLFNGPRLADGALRRLPRMSGDLHFSRIKMFYVDKLVEYAEEERPVLIPVVAIGLATFVLRNFLPFKRRPITVAICVGSCRYQQTGRA